MRVCIVGASGKLGRYMIRHALDRGHEVVGVCRARSVDKLAEFAGRITVVPGATNDREVIGRAVAGCDGVLTVLVPWGVEGYATGTAQAVLDLAPPGARLVFSCGWHITRDGQDRYPWSLRLTTAIFGPVARLFRVADLDDQVEACRRVFASDTRWTVVRGSDLEEGGSEGLPVWRRHVGDPALASNRTRRVDFALFMVHALEDDALVREAPAIVGRGTPSAMAAAHPGDAEAARGPGGAWGTLIATAAGAALANGLLPGLAIAGYALAVRDGARISAFASAVAEPLALLGSALVPASVAAWRRLAAGPAWRRGLRLGIAAAIGVAAGSALAGDVDGWTAAGAVAFPAAAVLAALSRARHGGGDARVAPRVRSPALTSRPR